MPSVRSWLALQKEFGEEWVLAENAETLNTLLRQNRPNPAPVRAETVVGEIVPLSRKRPPEPLIPGLQPDLSGIKTLEELKQVVLAFDGCALKATATHTVFADGNPASPIMWVGEAPGAEEDKQGLPFVGPSGQLLNKMMAAIGLTRENAYITNVVFWRPPGNRPPTPTEMAMCLPFLNKHLELVSPKILVLLGMTAMKAILKTPTSLAQARGVWHAYAPAQGGRPIPTRVTYHPSYLLRSPGQKAQAWVDLMTIRDALETGDFYG